MQTQPPKVSIITINYNQAEVTLACLRSLQKLKYPAFEVWVVDNHSSSSQQVDPLSFPEFHFLFSGENLGFSGGNNLAISKAQGDFILLLNNDTIVPDDLLEKLVNTFQQFPQAGIVSPKILYHNTQDLIQYAGTAAINPFTCRGRTRGYHQHDSGQFDQITATDLAHGACMMIRKEVFERIGYLYDPYFIYYEEYDFCERARKAGFAVYFNGLTHILHKESVSVGKLSPLKSFYMARNRVLFARRNFALRERIIALAYYYLLALPKNLFTNLLQGRLPNAVATARGAVAGFTGRVLTP